MNGYALMYLVTAAMPRSATGKSAVSTAAASTAPVFSSAQSSCGNPPSVTTAYPTTLVGLVAVFRDARKAVDAGGKERMTIRAALVAFGHDDPDPKEEVAT